MALTKHDILEQVNTKIGFPKNQSAEIVESLIEIIKATMASGDDVLVSGFGKFCVKERKERKGRHPVTGDDTLLAARRVVTFKCSAKLREQVNGTMNTSASRRRYPRHAALFAVTYTVNSVTYRDLVKDVSAGGIYIGTWRAIQNGQRISLRFPVSAFEKKPSVMGTVMRSQDKGFAVIFDTPIEEKICRNGRTPEIDDRFPFQSPGPVHKNELNRDSKRTDNGLLSLR